MTNARPILLFSICLFALTSTAIAQCLSSETEKAFKQRVKHYIELREKAGASLPRVKTTSDPSKIDARQDALARAIRGLRSDARQGDIFGPDIAACLAASIRNNLTPSAKRTTQEGNPAVEGGSVQIKVNGIYPSEAPLSTVPPKLLMQLPKLPDGLEYRFVGRYLVLYDTEATMIADFIPNVTS